MLGPTSGTALGKRDWDAVPMSESSGATGVEASGRRPGSLCWAVVAALGVAALGGATALLLAQQAHAHLLLAIELALVASVAIFRLRPWAHAHPWSAATARLMATMALASGLAPIHLPAWPHAAVPPALGLLASTEALFLLCLTVVLPLSLGQHLWVQALSLNLALTRMKALSLHTLAVGRGQQCEALVLRARAAIAAVLIGAPAQLPTPTAEQQCWMLHAWAVAVLGHLLPTVVHVAAWHYGRRLQRQGVPDAAVKLARSIRTRQRLRISMRQEWRLQAAAVAARQLGRPDDEQPDSSWRAAFGRDAFHVLGQQQSTEDLAGAAATAPSGADPGANRSREEAQDQHNRGIPFGSWPGLFAAVKQRCPLPALALSQLPQLVQLLLLLLPAATLVWCALEVAVSASWP